MQIQTISVMVWGQTCDVMAGDSLLSISVLSGHQHQQPLSAETSPAVHKQGCGPPTSQDIRAHSCCVSRLGFITVPGSVFHRRRFVDAYTSTIF